MEAEDERKKKKELSIVCVANARLIAGA